MSLSTCYCMHCIIGMLLAQSNNKLYQAKLSFISQCKKMRAMLWQISILFPAFALSSIDDDDPWRKKMVYKWQTVQLN